MIVLGTLSLLNREDYEKILIDSYFVELFTLSKCSVILLSNYMEELHCLGC